jgi:hypothetical protein
MLTQNKRKKNFSASPFLFFIHSVHAHQNSTILDDRQTVCENHDEFENFSHNFVEYKKTKVLLAFAYHFIQIQILTISVSMETIYSILSALYSPFF